MILVCCFDVVGAWQCCSGTVLIVRWWCWACWCLEQSKSTSACNAIIKWLWWCHSCVDRNQCFDEVCNGVEQCNFNCGVGSLESMFRTVRWHSCSCADKMTVCSLFRTINSFLRCRSGCAVGHAPASRSGTSLVEFRDGVLRTSFSILIRLNCC